MVLSIIGKTRSPIKSFGDDRLRGGLNAFFGFINEGKKEQGIE
jgi:hypothetical protein